MLLLHLEPGGFHLLLVHFALELVQVVHYLLVQFVEFIVAQVILALAVRPPFTKIITLLSPVVFVILLYPLDQVLSFVGQHLPLAFVVVP